MSRQPVVGSDSGTWGGILDDYLSVSLATDGTLKAFAGTTLPHTPTVGTTSTVSLRGSAITLSDRRLDAVESGYLTQNSNSDQSAGLQAAFNAAQLANAGLGCGVHIPAGTYRMGSTTVTPPSSRTLELTGEGGGGTAFPQTGATVLYWPTDTGALFGSYALDLTNVSQFRVRDLAFQGPGTGVATQDGGSPCAMSCIKATSGSLIERVGISNFSAGIAYPRADHSTVRSTCVVNCAYGIHWLPSMATGSDQHFDDMLLQTYCAGFSFAASAFFAGSSATSVGFFAPVGVFRYDDGVGSATAFLGVTSPGISSTFGGMCSTEAAGTAAIFDELYASSTRGGIVSGCEFNSGFIYQPPSAGQHQWSGTFAVVSASGTDLQVTVTQGFIFRPGMTVTGAGVPANTTITTVNTAWSHAGTIDLTVNNSLTAPTSVVIGQPQLGSVVANFIVNNHFHGTIIATASGFPILYGGTRVAENRVDDGVNALAIGSSSGMIGGPVSGSLSRCGGNVYGIGGDLGIYGEAMASGVGCTQGDLLMRVTGSGLTQADGTRKPYGLALRTVAAGARLPVDVQYRGSTLVGGYNGPLVRNLSGVSITAGQLVYVDAAHPGGVTASVPGSGWTAPIGINAAGTITNGTTGRLDELWL